MAKGNQGFADLVGSSADLAPRRPPRTGILGGRENRLAEIVQGTATTRVHELVDPLQCRIWEGHNRDYDALDETVCADLIASLKAQGRQEVPAIVRRIHDEPSVRFEVICGARRHWSVSWLRAHDYPELRFLVEPRELTDEEAFRVADLENRSRLDLSDYERAHDYARAVERYYEGNQQRMVERLQISKGWLSRYLELARLPEVVVSCFGSPHAIKVSHAATLAPLLNNPQDRVRLLRAAHDLAEAGKAASSAQVVARLAAAVREPTRQAARREHLKDAQGRILATVQRQGRGAAFAVADVRRSDPDAVAAAIAGWLSGK